MSLTTKLGFSLGTTQLLSSDGFSVPTDSAAFPLTGFTWASGVGANQADLVYRANRTLAASASENLDLAGSLTDRFGNVLTFARIKLLAIYNQNAAAGDILTVGGAAANAWEAWTPVAGSKLYVPPGGLELKIAPDATAWAVTAATADILKVANGSGTHAVTYSILIVGASA